MKIETLIFNRENSKESWVICEHKSWEELLEDGWTFQNLTKRNEVVMTRNGYINYFRNKIVQ